MDHLYVWGVIFPAIFAYAVISVAMAWSNEQALNPWYCGCERVNSFSVKLCDPLNNYMEWCRDHEIDLLKGTRINRMKGGLAVFYSLTFASLSWNMAGQKFLMWSQIDQVIYLFVLAFVTLMLFTPGALAAFALRPVKETQYKLARLTDYSD